MSIADLRKHYTRGGLEPGDLDPDPIGQFEAWLHEAVDSGLLEPTAMTLASADRAGRPSARMVLLKGVDARGFVFFTNYRSRKAGELDENPQAALVFYWHPLERQVRVEGGVERLSRAESEAYFKRRPYESQLGAWASPQSQPIAGRAVLEERLAELSRTYPEGRVPLPDFWGGYLVVPEALEFWQGRVSRLHDRFRYTREGELWRLERLAP